MLYFERLAERAEEGQGGAEGLSDGAEGRVFGGAGRRLKRGLCQRGLEGAVAKLCLHFSHLTQSIGKL